MSWLRKTCVVSAALAALALSIDRAAPTAFAAPPPTTGSAPVTIVGPLPVPVSGSVGLASGSSVNIANAVLSVRALDNPAMQPFQATFSVPYRNPGVDGKIAVPAGKRLVLEFASIDVGVAPQCLVAYISISTTAGGDHATFIVPTIHLPSATRNVDLAGQPVRIYADPGTEADVTYATRGDNCDHSGLISVSGHFVDLP